MSFKSVFLVYQKMDQLTLPLKVVCTLGKKLHHLFPISVDQWHGWRHIPFSNQSYHPTYYWSSSTTARILRSQRSLITTWSIQAFLPLQQYQRHRHFSTQHISWSHGNVNEDHLAPLGSYIHWQHLAAETFGGWHRVGEREIKKLGSALARHTGQDEGEAVHHLWGRLGILLQRGNAAILGNRIPNFPPPQVDGIHEWKEYLM